MKALAKLNSYFLQYKGLLAIGVLLVLVAVVFKLFPALLIRNSFDAIAQVIEQYQEGAPIALEKVKWELVSYGLYIIASALLQGVFMYFMRQTIIVVSRHIEFDLKNTIYRQYQRLTIDFFKRNNTGDLMNRISEDVSRVRMYVGPAIMYALNTGFTIVIVLSIMFSVNVKLTLYTLLPLPLLAFTIYKVANTINARSHVVQKKLSDLSTFAQETFSGMRVIRSYERMPWFNAYFKKMAYEYRDNNERLFRVNALFMPLMILMVGVSTLITIYIGGQLYIAGKISAGNITEFIYYVNLLTWPIASIGWVTSLVQRAEASMSRINDFLDEQPSFESGTHVGTGTIQGAISFQNVSFTYPNSGIEALKDISFEIPPGKSLGILGKTGSGKSTIAALLARQYDPTSGQLNIDGVALKDWDTATYKAQLGWVPQEAFLFSDTIANNIAFGASNATQQRIEESATLAGIHQSITEFKDGYQTAVGERGITLSGGQKQRVSIARALIKDPRILVFDDSLSAVDTETEDTILNNIKATSVQKTTVIIAHRVSSVKHCDLIICLDGGQIVQHGTHESLSQREGHYAELLEMQREN